MILDYLQHRPKIGGEVFIAPDAWIIGQVELGERTSVFFGSVLRGDINPIRIGNESNVQDQVMIHTSRGRTPTIIGRRASIGHRAILHGCTIGDRSLVGMGAIVLDETVIEEECLIAAGSVVTERQVIPARSLIAGVPARIVRRLTDDDVRMIDGTAEAYLGKRHDYLAMNLPLSPEAYHAAVNHAVNDAATSAKLPPLK